MKRIEKMPRQSVLKDFQKKPRDAEKGRWGKKRGKEIKNLRRGAAGGKMTALFYAY